MPSKLTTYDGALAELRNAFGADLFKEMERYVQGHQPNWWGENGSEDYVKLMLVATCLHDARCYSYRSIIQILAPKIRIYSNALQHNVKLLRRVLAEWASKQIYLPNRATLDAAVAGKRLPAWMRSVRWWLDSTDIPLRRTKIFRKHSGQYWSGKIGRPAWRFMSLRDGSGRIRRLWGGYSPKLYDAHFLVTQRQWLEENLRGTAILADTHFFAARDAIRDPEILATPPPNAGAELLARRGFAGTKKTADEKASDIREKRGVVEQVFSRTKKIFLSLSGAAYHVWAESELELNHVVTWAFGVHNRLCDLRDQWAK